VKRVLFEKYKKLLIYPSLVEEAKPSTPVAIDRRTSSVIFAASQLSIDMSSKSEWETGRSAYSLYI
jgi:hypothetical protein